MKGRGRGAVKALEGYVGEVKEVIVSSIYSVREPESCETCYR